MRGNHETGRRALHRATSLLPPAGCAAAPSGPPLASPEPDVAALDPRLDARPGVYAIDTGSGREIVHRGDELFPMCSTLKVLGVAAVLDRTPTAHLDDRVRYTAADHRAERGDRHDGPRASIRYSDNTAANLLLADVGGPGEVTRLARSSVTRLDRTEPT